MDVVRSKNGLLLPIWKLDMGSNNYVQYFFRDLISCYEYLRVENVFGIYGERIPFTTINY